MQFIPLNNMISMLIAGTSVGVNFTDTSLQTRAVNGAQLSGIRVFPHQSGIKTATSGSYSLATASSSSTIPKDTYSIPNAIGTTSNRYVSSSNGWSLELDVSSVSDATINSFFFVKKVAYGTSSSEADAVIYAVKLDNPVMLNSTNNHTAHFVFSIAFE